MMDLEMKNGSKGGQGKGTVVNEPTLEEGAMK
jgi:hypothetical protein